MAAVGPGYRYRLGLRRLHQRDRAPARDAEPLTADRVPRLRPGRGVGHHRYRSSLRSSSELSDPFSFRCPLKGSDCSYESDLSWPLRIRTHCDHPVLVGVRPGPAHLRDLALLAGTASSSCRRSSRRSPQRRSTLSKVVSRSAEKAQNGSRPSCCSTYQAQLAAARTEAAQIRDGARAEGQRIVEEHACDAGAGLNRPASSPAARSMLASPARRASCVSCAARLGSLAVQLSEKHRRPAACPTTPQVQQLRSTQFLASTGIRTADAVRRWCSGMISETAGAPA